MVHVNFTFNFGIYRTFIEAGKENIYIDEGYAPLLEQFDRHPGIKANLFIEGVTLQAINERRPDLIKLIRKGMDRNQLEIGTYTFNHPVLTLIPYEDCYRQIEEGIKANREILGVKQMGFMLPEQAWDPSMPKILQDLGIQYLIIGGSIVTRDYPDLQLQDMHKPFIMRADLVGAFFGPLNDGPFPEHYEPVESPTKNLLSKQQMNPVAKIWTVPDQKNDLAPVASPEYPYVVTTYRLTEHHLSGVMSRYLPMLAELFHSHFAEISNELAAELGIKNGERITVATPRGKIHTTAMVTSRLKPFMIDGKKTHQIGIPWHWGYNGISKGDITNDLSATVGDPTVYIQETKAFLCSVKKGEV
jgi:anaerobic selenocysteine-containing dehydrogenase